MSDIPIILFPEGLLAFEGSVKSLVILKPETCGNAVRRYTVLVIAKDRRKVQPEFSELQPAAEGISVWSDSAAAGRVQDLPPQVLAPGNPGISTPGGELGIEA